MPALILVNQATRPAGVAGKARSDGVISQLVTCTNNTVEGSYLWTLVDAPIRSALVRGTTGTGASFTFTPDVKGTYTVSLRVNASAAPADNDTTYLAIRTSGGKTLAWRYQAAGETTEDNEDFPGLGFPGNTNVRGWATNEDLIFEEVEESVWETQNAITTFAGVVQRVVMTDPATGKVSPTLISGTAPTGPAGGDLTGTYPSPSVVALRGRALSSTWAPLDGQVFWWNAGANEFQLSSDVLTQTTGVQAAIQDGAAATPAIRWKSDTNTGFYRPGTDTLGLASGGQSVAQFRRPLVAAAGTLATMDLVSDVSAISGTAGYSNIRMDVQGAATGSGPRRLLHFTDNSAERLQVMDSGQVRVVSGTAGAPPYAFISETNSGLFLQSAGVLGFSVAGIEKLRMNATDGVASVHWLPSTTVTYDLGNATFRWNNVFASSISVSTGLFADGSNAVPSISFTADTDTGIYRVGADQVGTTTNGVLRTTVSTTALTSTLPFRGPNGSAATPTYSFANDPDTGLTISPAGGAGVLGFILDGAERALLTYDANGAIFQNGFGSAAQPAFCFFGDSNTGFYRVSTDVLGLAAGGTSVVQVSTTQMLTLDGAVGTPSHSFINDSNTGLYSVSADTIGVACSGVLAAQFGQLQTRIPDGFNEANPGIVFLGDTNTGLYSRGADELGFSAGGAGRMYLTTTGLLPDNDNVETLGSGSNRWADLFAVTTTIGDLVMRNPHARDKALEEIEHWKLIEGLDTIYAYNIRTKKKYALAMVEVSEDDKDRALMDAERARWVP